jgi:hypothetical protein
VEKERELAGRLAGVLFLTAGLTGLGMLLLPGVEHGHRDWVIVLAAVCVAWGLFCVTLARPERHGAWFWHVPAAASLLIVGGMTAATGGADSPARMFLFFVVVCAAYFYAGTRRFPTCSGASRWRSCRCCTTTTRSRTATSAR